jgi:hypothetical protein
VAESLVVACKPLASAGDEVAVVLVSAAFPGFCPRFMVVRPGTSPLLTDNLRTKGSEPLLDDCDTVEALITG